MDLGEGCAPLLALVNRGARGVQKISITIISVNAHHYKYSILKREITRRINTNQKHSNINKEIVLYYIKGRSSRLAIEKWPIYRNQASCARGQIISQFMFITSDNYFVLKSEY